MKRSILTAAFMIGGIAAFAQKASIQDAINSRKEKDYTAAIQHIEKAMADPSTKDMAKTWKVRGDIYLEMQEDPKYKDTNPYMKAVESYLKVAELDAKYEKDVVANNLRSMSVRLYNDIVNAHNAKQHATAIGLVQPLQNIKTTAGATTLASFKLLDTLAANGRMLAAFSAFQDKKYDYAVPELLELRNNPITQSPQIFNALAIIYREQNKDNELSGLLAEARKLYPNDKGLEQEELNYYTRTGQQDVFLKKLADAVAQDPANHNYHSALATAYTTMAFPKDNAGKDLPKPANYDELISKAGAAYTALMKVAPNDPVYNFNAGAFYFNQASDYIKQMNAINGNTAADKKKTEELSNKTAGSFVLAADYFEKAVLTLEPNIKTANGDDKSTYWSSLSALKTIYTRQDKMDKVAEVKAKMEAMKK
jgi:hypothetical protein